LGESEFSLVKLRRKLRLKNKFSMMTKCMLILANIKRARKLN